MIMQYAFLNKFIAGGFEEIPAPSDIANLIRDAVYILSSRATEGNFRLLIEDPPADIDLGCFPNQAATPNVAPSTGDHIFKEDIFNVVVVACQNSLQSMIVDGEQLWIFLACETSSTDHWDHNFFKASELFHDACNSQFPNGWGDIEIYGPLHELVVFNRYENGEITDGWGQEVQDGDPSGLILDSQKNWQKNNVTSREFVPEMMRYWR